MNDAEQENADNAFERMVGKAHDAAVKLGLPPAFLLEIVEDSDWGFVIKLNALFESALEEVIHKNCFASPFARPRDEKALRKFCSSLNTVGRSGKLALATAFDLISPDLRKYLENLASLRNSFAHGVSGADLTIRKAAEASERGVLAFHQQFVPFLTRQEFLNVEPRMMRFYFAMSGMLHLWDLEYRSRPPASLFGSILTGAWPPGSPQLENLAEDPPAPLQD